MLKIKQMYIVLDTRSPQIERYAEIKSKYFNIFDKKVFGYYLDVEGDHSPFGGLGGIFENKATLINELKKPLFQYVYKITPVKVTIEL